MDPLHKLLDLLFGLFQHVTTVYPEKIKFILGAEIIGIVLYVSWYLISMRKYDVEEKLWSDICATFLNRIDVIIPQYQLAMRDLTIHMIKRIQSDDALLVLANSIPFEVKMKAERDYCNHDIHKDEVTLNLLMQLRGLKEVNG